LPWIIRRDIETIYVKDDPEFDEVGNIAALRGSGRKCAADLDGCGGRTRKGGCRVSGPITEVCEPVKMLDDVS